MGGKTVCNKVCLDVVSTATSCLVMSQFSQVDETPG